MALSARAVIDCIQEKIYVEKIQKVTTSLVYKMIMHALNTYLMDGTPLMAPLGPASSCLLYFAKQNSGGSALHKGCLLYVVLFNLQHRYGVSGGFDRGSGESATGSRGRPRGDHHLLITHCLLLKVSQKAVSTPSNSIQYIVLFTCHSQSGCFVVKYGLLNPKEVYSILVEYWDTVHVQYIAICA